MADLPLVVFDVNETILDLETIESIFERIFGEKGVMRLWFANLFLYSEALSVVGHYVSFNKLDFGRSENACRHPQYQNW
jgi:2-haloacid dehalogenase